MFTGLIEEVGVLRRKVRRETGAHLHIAATRVLQGVAIGDSIAVSGPCLTVVELGEQHFVADCMPETLARSTLGELRPGAPVNLERALALGDRLGGHMVAGHVDAVGEVLAVSPRGISSELRISLPAVLLPFIAPKGSVAVDGISLTVVEVGQTDFVVGIIPHTLSVTTLAEVAPGQRVNLESDLIARYVHRALGFAEGSPSREGPSPGSGWANGTDGAGLTEDFLRRHGY